MVQQFNPSPNAIIRQNPVKGGGYTLPRHLHIPGPGTQDIGDGHVGVPALGLAWRGPQPGAHVATGVPGNPGNVVVIRQTT